MIIIKDNTIVLKKQKLAEDMDKNKITRKEYNRQMGELDVEMRRAIDRAKESEPKIVPIVSKKEKEKIKEEVWKPELPKKRGRPKKVIVQDNPRKIVVVESNLLKGSDTPINTMRRFKGALFAGKKAQQQGGAFSNAKVSPVLIAGIIIYIIPLVLNAMGSKVPSIIGTIGFIVIILGVILSFLEAVG